MIRVGLIGFGVIGRDLYARMCAPGSPLTPAFIHSRSMNSLAGVPSKLTLEDLTQVAQREPDLIVEAAHPDITKDFGRHLVAVADYLPLSVTALADVRVCEELLDVAQRHARHVLLPHGALVGADSLFEWRRMWRTVSITFRKHPRNIDFSCYGASAAEIQQERVLFDGRVRQIAQLFPTNVNAMVTCALLTVGPDECGARLIADPALDKAVLEIDAHGSDGSHLFIRREQPAVGVSGTEMAESLYRSIVKAGGAFEPLDAV